MPSMKKLLEPIDQLSGNLTESLDESDVQTTFDLIRNNDMSFEEFMIWVYDIRRDAMDEVE